MNAENEGEQCKNLGAKDYRIESVKLEPPLQTPNNDANESS